MPHSGYHNSKRERGNDKSGFLGGLGGQKVKPLGVTAFSSVPPVPRKAALDRGGMAASGEPKGISGPRCPEPQLSPYP